MATSQGVVRLEPPYGAFGSAGSTTRGCVSVVTVEKHPVVGVGVGVCRVWVGICIDEWEFVDRKDRIRNGGGGGPPGHVTIQTEFFFNKDLEYLRFGNKGNMPVLLISKMKAARYPDFGLKLLVPEQMWIKDVCTYDISAKYVKLFFEELTSKNTRLLLLQGHLDHLSGSDKRMLSTAVKLWTRNLVIRQRVEDFQLGIESYQTQLNLTKPGWDATGYEFKHDYTIIESPRAVIFLVNNNERKIMRFNEIYKFSDGTLTRILETLDYRVKEFKIKRLNLGMNTRFWTEKDVTRSKEFITAIERRLKTRRIYRNLECFVGGRVRDIDYRLLQRTE
ncbi:hypothetical protein Tco_0599886 [Tanacetum coccineum]